MSVQTQFTEEHHDTFGENVTGVELVLPTAAHDSALNSAALRLVGVLQRRMWDRRRDMLQRRAMNTITAVPDPLDPIELDQAGVLDLMNAATWDVRLEGLRAGVHALDSQQVVVRTRAWDEFESGVLVDSRSAIGPVFDVAVMAVAAVELLRNGDQQVLFLIPEPVDAAETKLWSELICLTEDRLGIDRGTIRYTSRVVKSS